MNSVLDVAIVGGGILGLLTLRELTSRSVSAFLFEGGELGGDQTLHSQAFLIRGHLYARKRTPPLFGPSVALWDDLLAQHGIASAQPTYFAIETDNAVQYRTNWTKRGLPYEKVRLPPHDLDLTDLDLYDTSERYVPDAEGLVRAILDGGDLWTRVVRGSVTRIDATTGELDVNVEGSPTTLRAGAIAVASGRRAFCGLSPKSKIVDDGSKIAALVVRADPLPSYSLVVPIESVPGRAFVPWMCVPRQHAPSGDRAWLCSALLPQDAGDWVNRTVDGLRGRCTLLTSSMKVSTYEERFWPDFGSPHGFQLETTENVAASWPARLTLAPVAALALSDAVERIRRGNSSARPSVGPFGPAPSIAQERWRRL
jgi:hypothetical protein